MLHTGGVACLQRECGRIGQQLDPVRAILCLHGKAGVLQCRGKRRRFGVQRDDEQRICAAGQTAERVEEICTVCTDEIELHADGVLGAVDPRFFAVDRNLQRRNSPAAFAELRRNLGQQRVKLAVAVEVERAFRRVLQQFGICSRDALELRGDRDRLVHIADGHVERPGRHSPRSDPARSRIPRPHSSRPIQIRDPVRSVPVPPRPSRTRRRARDP